MQKNQIRGNQPCHRHCEQNTRLAWQSILFLLQSGLPRIYFVNSHNDDKKLNYRASPATRSQWRQPFARNDKENFVIASEQRERGNLFYWFCQKCVFALCEYRLPRGFYTKST